MNELPHLTESCRQCANPIEHINAIWCANCLREPPFFDYSYSLFHYAHPLDFLISQLKFQQQLNVAIILGNLLAPYLYQKYLLFGRFPDALIPVPLHPKRLQERGFNQAVEIAKPIAKKLKIPIDYFSLNRSKYTEAQSILSTKLRKQNVYNAFSSNQNYHNQHLLLIDDVITTAATVGEIAKLLKKQGARQIDVASLARSSII